MRKYTVVVLTDNSDNGEYVVYHVEAADKAIAENLAGERFGSRGATGAVVFDGWQYESLT